MTVLTDAYERGAQNALAKFAATRGVKEIRKALAAGDDARANRLATTPGLLSPTNTYGTQITDLGRGGEGLATLVAHPQHGIAVRKMYDPAGTAYSPEFVTRKEQLANLPGMARVLGTGQTRQGTPIHFSEPVAGSQPHPNSPHYLAAKKRLQSAAQAQGFHLADLRPNNARRTPSGEIKFIDSIPLKPDELHSHHATMPANVVPVHQDAVPHLFGSAIQTRATSPRELLAPIPGTHTFGMTDARFNQVMDQRGVVHNGIFKQHMLAPGAPPRPMTQPTPAVSPTAVTQRPSAPSLSQQLPTAAPSFRRMSGGPR